MYIVFSEKSIIIVFRKIVNLIFLYIVNFITLTIFVYYVIPLKICFFIKIAPPSQLARTAETPFPASAEAIAQVFLTIYIYI